MAAPWTLTLPKSLSSLVHACEKVCVAECCGLEAFEFTPGRMADWVQAEGIHAARGALIQLDRLIAEVSSTSGEVSCHELNAWWKPGECAADLKSWQSTLTAAIRASGGDKC